MHQFARRGQSNPLLILLLAGIVIAAVLILTLYVGQPDDNPDATKITVHCAAGLRFPMEEIAAKYEEEFGIKVELNFAGSNALLTKIKANKFDRTDLYLAADDFYTDKAYEMGLASERLSIARMRPVITVRKDSKKEIHTIYDLLDEDVQVVLASPDQAAVGKAVRDSLSKIKVGDQTLWEKLDEHITKHGHYTETVNYVANDVKLGTAADAGIVWDSTVAMPTFSDDLIAIPVPELEGNPNLISICVLNGSNQPTAALQFARYVTARDKGLVSFKKFGTQPVDGDKWVKRPSITFFCGAVNKRAVESIVEEFSKRENVEVKTIYDGCGILTSRMGTIADQSTASGFPDVYMACDTYYLENVKTWFEKLADVSQNEVVLVVPKGSDKVKSLPDIVLPDVRVSVGEPDQCTIGALTRRLLQGEGLWEDFEKKKAKGGEVIVEKSSSALIIPDVAGGHVDAALAYLSDAKSSADQIDIIRIESKLKTAVQPFSVANSSDHKHLVRRLYQRVANSKEAFENAGFDFLLEAKPKPEPSQAKTE